MLDRLVAEIVLDGPRVVVVIGELVAAGVAQHVDVNREAELRPFADVLDLPIEGIRREWGAALTGEHKLGVRIERLLRTRRRGPFRKAEPALEPY
jgi:hypothetical protein